jgi:hypothetical protein
MSTGVPYTMIEACSVPVDEDPNISLKYNPGIWKGLVLYDQEVTYLGPMMFQLLWDATLPYVIGQTLSTGTVMSEQLAFKMMGNEHLQEHPPHEMLPEQDPSQAMVEVMPDNHPKRKPALTRRRQPSTKDDSEKPRKKVKRTTTLYDCKRNSELRTAATKKVNAKEIFITGFLDPNVEKPVEKITIKGNQEKEPIEEKQTYTYNEDIDETLKYIRRESEMLTPESWCTSNDDAIYRQCQEDIINNLFDDVHIVMNL